jgi:hypothetical protein
MYILQNNLENEIVIGDTSFLGLMTAEDVALEFGVGIETVKVWYDLKILDGIRVCDSIYFYNTDKRVR